MPIRYDPASRIKEPMTGNAGRHLAGRAALLLGVPAPATDDDRVLIGAGDEARPASQHDGYSGPEFEQHRYFA
ncbi:MAG: hypothetical protein ABI613_09045 [Gemmatimonadota bacterium]